ncbi:ester cyclase [Natronobeatus ordinarius]|uniref:ester cyclase n=1 Tax=Natronobeatus ordinarius TaxID=2963433 RepID=UPI0020CF92F9|nr:ester cyclase [Natronobeatus ordinarius]
MTTPRESGSKVTPAHLILREVWSTGDVALIDDLLTDDHVHHEPLLPEPLEGREPLKEWIETVREGAPDLTKTVGETYVDGDAVIVTYTATATHEGDILGIAPTGRSIEVDGVYVHQVEDGKLAETTDSWDAFGLFAQLGAFPEVR